MWILKGSFLGLWVFAFGTLAFLYLAVYRSLRPNTAVGLSVIASYTTWNPFWWGTLPVAIVAGCLVARSWPGNRWVWVSLMATFLFPVGLLALVPALVAKSRHGG
jgi:hypothetical protein